MITGSKVAAAEEGTQLANDIADALGIPHARMSTGGTVVSAFLDDVHRRLVRDADGRN